MFKLNLITFVKKMNSFTTVIDLQFQIHDVTHDKTHHSKMDLKTMLFGNGWKRGQRNQTQDIAATSEVDTKNVRMDCLCRVNQRLHRGVLIHNTFVIFCSLNCLIILLVHGVPSFHLLILILKLYCQCDVVNIRVRLLKRLIAYQVDKATVTICTCITTKCFKRRQIFFYLTIIQ